MNIVGKNKIAINGFKKNAWIEAAFDSGKANWIAVNTRSGGTHASRARGSSIKASAVAKANSSHVNFALAAWGVSQGTWQVHTTPSSSGSGLVMSGSFGV